MRNLPIVEFGSAGEFIKEMKKIYVKEKEKGRADRYKLTIANGNQKAVFGPTVTTQRVETLLFQGIDEIDAEMIEKAGEEIEVNITKCLNYWFDERREPPIWPQGKKKEVKG